MTFKELVNKELGGSTALAKELGISRQGVCNMFRRGVSRPAALKLEEITNGKFSALALLRMEGGNES